MSKRAHGQIRRGQVITTYGPGALIDLPREAAIVAGLESWPRPQDLEEVVEPRLTAKLEKITGLKSPPLYSPPPESTDYRESVRGIDAYRFPEWCVVQEPLGGDERARSRRLVPRTALVKGRFEGHPVVPTRFVRACPRGHVDDIDWYAFVHSDSGDRCRRQLWLDERGTGGDLADLVVRCECGKQRLLYEAAQIEERQLGTCRGARPWLGRNASEPCSHPSRLLIRTASNAYFPQVVSVLSLPDRGSVVETAVRELWDNLQLVKNLENLEYERQRPKVAQALAPYNDDDVLAAIENVRTGRGSDRPVKQVELDAILAAPEGFGDDDVPIDPNFHARRLPDRAWRHSTRFDAVERIVQLHRLREILALIGFTRLEAITPDIQGEFESDVQRAELAIEPRWFPAVENRGEGLFLQLQADAIEEWLERPAVAQRLERLARGHQLWADDRRSKRTFPGGPYVLLHTLSHLLIQSVAMRCGYPASSIRERIYVDPTSGHYGLLLYTGSPDAEGTLGGLVQQGRHVEDHLVHALHQATLCSHDPICSQHQPGESLERRWLHGAACHGCALVAETSCEMRNDYLDRALVAPVIGVADAAFFRGVG